MWKDICDLIPYEKMDKKTFKAHTSTFSSADLAFWFLYSMILQKAAEDGCVPPKILASLAEEAIQMDDVSSTNLELIFSVI